MERSFTNPPEGSHHLVSAPRLIELVKFYIVQNQITVWHVVLAFRSSRSIINVTSSVMNSDTTCLPLLVRGVFAFIELVFKSTGTHSRFGVFFFLWLNRSFSGHKNQLVRVVFPSYSTRSYGYSSSNACSGFIIFYLRLSNIGC